MIYTSTKIKLTNDKTGNYVWLDLPTSEEEVIEAFRQLGIAVDEDQFDFYDSETYPSGFSIEAIRSNLPTDNLNEPLYTHNIQTFTISDISDIISDIEDFDDEDTVEALMDYYDGDIAETISALRNYDINFYPNVDLAELAEQFVDDGMFSNETLLQYIDFEALGRDLGFDGYKETSNGVLYIG